jgi:signal transduction histidine kinase
MRVKLSTKQALGVAALIALSMAVLSIVHLSSLVRVELENSRANGQMLAQVLYQRARETIAGSSDPRLALRADPAMRSILSSTVAYGRSVTYATIVDTRGVAIVHSFPALENEPVTPQTSLEQVLKDSRLGQAHAIYADKTLEVVQPLQLGDTPFGAIRIGLSPVLIRSDLSQALKPVLWTTAAISGLSILAGLFLARRVLRPIHLISSGLLRLERGETGVTIDLPYEEELQDVGHAFTAISRQLADRKPGGAQSKQLALFNRLLAGVAHEVKNPLNAMTIHLELVRQHLDEAAEHLSQSTIDRAHLEQPERSVLGITGAESVGKSQASATATRSRAGDDVRLADGQMASMASALHDAREHTQVIAHEILRLDEVVQNFLRFIRPEQLQLQPVDASELMREVLSLVEPDARRAGVTCRADFSDRVPFLQADPALLRQAVLNLALNACQAMESGGTLTMSARSGPGQFATLEVHDTGPGLTPDQLDRVFDLYYTTKPGGSGIGLSMVYRITQLHGGEVEVESMPGRETTFRLRLPLAVAS